MVSQLAEIATQVHPLAILLVEDDLVDARIVEKNLQKGSSRPFAMRRAATLAEAVDQVAAGELDVILLDLSLPDGHGVALVEQMIASAPHVPIVILTGLDDERVALEAVGLGAQDYLLKGDIGARSLHDSIRFAIERHRLRRELDEVKARESETKDKFLSHVSHELRTPLTAVLQFTTILRDGIAGEVSPQQEEYLGIIQRNAEQLKKMINTLMEVTRSASGKLTCNKERISLEPVVSSAVATLSKQAVEKGVSLELELGERVPEVVADSGRIEQVLDNLIENAIKFTPPGGTVVVSHRLVDGAVQIAIRDTGCGIGSATAERVFDRLYQAEGQADVSRKGLGLGLHISREIITMHGGRIWVESEEGKGSTFLFSIPAWSLESVLKGVAVVDGKLEPAVGLIALRLSPGSGSAQAKGIDSALPAAMKMFEQCMLGVSDVVVPACGHGSGRNVLFGLARADAVGAEAIARRVGDEFKRHRQLGVAGFFGSVTTQSYRLDQGSDLTQGQVIAALAERIGQDMAAWSGGRREER
ncbi:MAG: hybrid sensor histidine kinase/response regulator [Planctomycetes bacterium]|nr:hybrid sensor histidine kinase/response regulator [Planctomycetota bacterium]